MKLNESIITVHKEFRLIDGKLCSAVINKYKAEKFPENSGRILDTCVTYTPGEWTRANFDSLMFCVRRNDRNRITFGDCGRDNEHNWRRYECEARGWVRTNAGDIADGLLCDFRNHWNGWMNRELEDDGDNAWWFLAREVRLIRDVTDKFV